MIKLTDMKIAGILSLAFGGSIFIGNEKPLNDASSVGPDRLPYFQLIK